MAKLAEVQSLEGGTFFIGNADALGITTTAMTVTAAATTFQQPQHVMLPGEHLLLLCCCMLFFFRKNPFRSMKSRGRSYDLNLSYTMSRANIYKKGRLFKWLRVSFKHHMFCLFFII